MRTVPTFPIRLLLCLVTAVVPLGASAQGTPKIEGPVHSKSSVVFQPLLGKYETYTVRRGDTLYKIARDRNLAVSAIQRANGLTIRSVKPGRQLILPTLHIPPMNPGVGIVLNIPERGLYLFRANQPTLFYPVAVGKPDWQTAIGQYKIRNKVIDPTWKPTKNMVQREGAKDEIVPAGPGNPLGDRWIGWSLPGFGFHSTTAPRSIGTVASHGCVRLYPEAARRLYTQVSVGMPIHALYQPVVLGKQEGKYYISVFPDIYHSGATSLASIKALLKKAGILEVTDARNLSRVVSLQSGYPERIYGADEALEVNGKPLTSAMRPSLANGRWIVPLRDTVVALGGQVTDVAGGSFQVTGGGHTLSLSPNNGSAVLDGNAIELPIAPSAVENTLLVPLAPLVQMFNAKVTVEKGKALRIESSPAPAPPR